MEHLRNLTSRFSRRGSSHVKSNKPSSSLLNKKISSQTVEFELIAESPPATLLGPPEQSSGALYACKLKVKVIGYASIRLVDLKVTLSRTFTTTRPVVEKCADCTTTVHVIKEWKLLSHPRVFTPGEHTFPISHLLPGDTCATTTGTLASLSYAFDVHAASDAGGVYTSVHPLLVSRALRQGQDRNSKRLFPPSEVIVYVSLPNVVYPSGDFSLATRINGIAQTRDNKQFRWVIRKIEWTVKELETAISTPCSRHSTTHEPITHKHSRDLADQALRGGWKVDYSSDTIELDLPCALLPQLSTQTDTSFNPPGTRQEHKISHVIEIELIAFREWAYLKSLHAATSTGEAKRLQTQFALSVTTRAGMGIAWDDEQPPLYQDVPESPPMYPHVSDYEGEDLNDDVERLQLS